MSVSDEINEFLKVESSEILKSRAQKIMEGKRVRFTEGIQMEIEPFSKLPEIDSEGPRIDAVACLARCRPEFFIDEKAETSLKTPERVYSDINDESVADIFRQDILKAMEEMKKIPPRPSPLGVSLFFCPGPVDYVRQTSMYFGGAFSSIDGKVYQNGRYIGTVEEYLERWRREHNITE